MYINLNENVSSQRLFMLKSLIKLIIEKLLDIIEFHWRINIE